MSTVDPEEIRRFSAMAHAWWDPHGAFKPLHDINPVRIGYILAHAAPAGRDVLDIGCGGGLVAEPMARLGAHVTAIDAAEKNIAAARLHAEQSGLNIDYRCMTAEALAAGGARFDLVLALEIVEHVADVDGFVAACLTLLRPGGTCVFSTLNRTAKSFALAVVGAEYLLRWLPRGTHHWKKFLRPSELAAAARRHGGEVKEMTGMRLNLLTGRWELDAEDLSVNYLMVVRKPGS
ncbi:MAG: bifunctional 2-polyprenyl-6-hydroxyphenol methylase/3-demethylubiquinol 3-O-methyltransferase UbiG [Alphaproteobacteria bacterium]|nr:bifunctional 2-polyprenyl-6-hydroxyphenol methylase/3-demethylubiquinol 3-O-methyltransferase UbiG [Alphaproteobacteria bacterium]